MQEKKSDNVLIETFSWVGFIKSTDHRPTDQPTTNH